MAMFVAYGKIARRTRRFGVCSFGKFKPKYSNKNLQAYIESYKSAKNWFQQTTCTQSSSLFSKYQNIKNFPRPFIL